MRSLICRSRVTTGNACCRGLKGRSRSLPRKHVCGVWDAAWGAGLQSGRSWLPIHSVRCEEGEEGVVSKAAWVCLVDALWTDCYGRLSKTKAPIVEGYAGLIRGRLVAALREVFIASERFRGV